MSATIVLDPETVYVWQVAATVSGDVQTSTFARFCLLADEEARQCEKLERQLPDASLLRVVLYEAYGLYEEALAQADLLAQLNPESLLVEAILKRLQQQRKGDGAPES